MACTKLKFALSLFALSSLACSKSEPETPAVQASAEHAEHPAPAATAGQVTPPAGAKVFFVGVADGAELRGPVADGKVTVKVQMGAENIEVRAAGEQVAGTGHHHIIVDGAGVALGAVVPKDEQHLHFGQGQTEAELQLPAGEHTLTLQFADGAHLSYGPQLSSTIKVKVVEDAKAAAATP
jgi:hypothetical protein